MDILRTRPTASLHSDRISDIHLHRFASHCRLKAMACATLRAIPMLPSVHLLYLIPGSPRSVHTSCWHSMYPLRASPALETAQFEAPPHSFPPVSCSYCCTVSSAPVVTPQSGTLTSGLILVTASCLRSDCRRSSSWSHIIYLNSLRSPFGLLRNLGRKCGSYRPYGCLRHLLLADLNILRYALDDSSGPFGSVRLDESLSSLTPYLYHLY